VCSQASSTKEIWKAESSQTSSTKEIWKAERRIWEKDLSTNDSQDISHRHIYCWEHMSASASVFLGLASTTASFRTLSGTGVGAGAGTDEVVLAFLIRVPTAVKIDGLGAFLAFMDSNSAVRRSISTVCRACISSI
jgi:hypothetical protein